MSRYYTTVSLPSGFRIRDIEEANSLRAATIAVLDRYPTIVSIAIMEAED